MTILNSIKQLLKTLFGNLFKKKVTKRVTAQVKYFTIDRVNYSVLIHNSVKKDVNNTITNVVKDSVKVSIWLSVLGSSMSPIRRPNSIQLDSIWEQV